MVKDFYTVQAEGYDGSVVFLQNYLTENIAYLNFYKHKEECACVSLFRNYEKIEEYVAESVSHV